MQGSTPERSQVSRAPGTVPPLTSSPLLDGPRVGSRRKSTYIRHVLVHPYNLLFLGTFLLAALMGTSLWILVWTLTVEGVVLGWLPTTRWVRRGVDDQLCQRERTEASQVRAALAAHMDPARRQELVELERRVDTIRTNVRQRGNATDPLLDEFIGLDRLLGSYVRLAVMSRVTSESLALTDRDALVAQRERLADELARAKNVQLRKAITRQLGLVGRRITCHDRNRQRLRTIDHQLSTIAEMVRLVHDQSLTLLDAGRAADMIELVLAELEQQEEALEEVISICSPDATVDLGEAPDPDELEQRATHPQRIRVAMS